MEKFKAAVCQMDTQDSVSENLEQAGLLLDAVCAQGVQLAVFPENVNYIGENSRAHAESIPGETSRFFCQEAVKRQIWILAGSLAERSDSGKPKNTSLLVDPRGRIAARYSKLHPFDVTLSDGLAWKESDTRTVGDEVVLADTRDLGCLGFSICYDLRFPELYRLLALKGAKIILVLANFTKNTGKDHWEVLLRARAIENGVYVIAADQWGKKPDMTSYGHSMIIDPWGNILAEVGEGVGFAVAEIDPDRVARVRGQIPSLKNRREDIYHLDSSRIRRF